MFQREEEEYTSTTSLLTGSVPDCWMFSKDNIKPRVIKVCFGGLRIEPEFQMKYFLEGLIVLYLNYICRHVDFCEDLEVWEVGV